MAIRQAFVVAVGLVFLVLGGLYVAARSYNESPDTPQPIWWKVVRGGVAIGSVAFLVYIGIVVLRAPNYLLGAGAATLCCGAAIRVVSGRTFTLPILRTTWLAYALAASLCAVGAALEGGPVGTLGAILSLIAAAFWSWVLVKAH